ncbi:MAG: Protein ImuB [Hydrocarboniphaga sp.]|uniref:Y-family DNA polymerase n=1 Tax=Hydrocarboniphaga sp. TaxID=2033016 RepID=UPI002638022A|nr:DNA polymerase Y family protein [Hydrocarboniphaga sp.]MDB5968111.1 Protein ImuB [Hydrocarboniphaga sp.]
MSTTGLWLCIELPQLPLEALALPSNEAAPEAAPLVVYAQHGSRRWVIAGRHPRIGNGEALGSVQARFPDVRAVPRDIAAETAALQAVGCLAYGLSDRIVLSNETPRGLFDRPFQAVNIDIAPSLKLFGGLAGLLDRARSLLGTLPYTTRLAVAPTLEGAAVAVRAGLTPLADAGALRSRLAELPLEFLRWPLAAQDLLLNSGHVHLGDVLRHDAASLAARLGREFPAALARLLGSAPDPRPWFTPPPRYRRKLDLDVEIDDWQALLFPLRRLFDEFEAYLRARQVAATQLALTLSRRRTENEAFVLRTTTPTQDAGVFLRLLRERWNARPPSAPASELRLRADQFVALQSPQTQLFDDGHSDGEAWNSLADRIRARLGDGALWRPGLAADHRPEFAWSRDGERCSERPLPPRPPWLLRRPQPWIPRVPLAAAPERISSGWWDEAPIARDYYRAKGADGEGLWVYQDRRDGRWYLQGLWQ